VKFSRNKHKRQPIGMLGRSSGNHDWLLANASACISCSFRLCNARNTSDCVWMETGLSHLRADCLETVISSGPNAMLVSSMELPLLFYFTFVYLLQKNQYNCITISHKLQKQTSIKGKERNVKWYRTEVYILATLNAEQFRAFTHSFIHSFIYSGISDSNGVHAPGRHL